ncbi:MAG: response regulator [Candidatus Omnitrophica bacterium]|nr:response regulator [Candidatus Omnitrophota bacterium]
MSRILVVDDEEKIRHLLATFLEKNGYEVIQSANGEEALEVLEKDASIDLLITDNRMPKLTGVDVARKLREEKNDIPIIVFSGSLGSWDEIPEINVILLKPINLDEVLDNIKTLLQKK